MRGTGHRQESLFKTNWKHAFTYGGVLRKRKLGRTSRPLSGREPIHLVLKAQKAFLRTGTLRSPYSRAIIERNIQKYARRFHIKIEQYSIQSDHIHFLIRAPKRFHYQYFFRVIAGQIAQQFQRAGALKSTMTGTPHGTQTTTKSCSGTGLKNCESSTGLWMYRPFTRVVRGYRAYRIVRDYVQLNEAEARGVIRYRKQRLKGLSMGEWELLWS
ncbi:MAG: hypothetical protein B7Y39_13185 [Bdellovibrio sp. 28-41-41]|nr:MAG: hypothetical protein B7Y39_13185 [Bdellovibrio sp. 28-41-41]